MRRFGLPAALLMAALAALGPACGDHPAPTVPVAISVPVEGAPWARVGAAQVEAARQAGVPVAFENASGLRFVFVPPGSFEMGAETTGGAHTVYIDRGYYLQVDALRGAPTPDGAPTDGLVHGRSGLTYAEALAIARTLTAGDGTWTYRLSTEAEWEYACRAGTTTSFWWGDDPALVAHAPARNPWGFEGMHVGAREWVEDRWGALPSWTVSDPHGPDEGAERVVRGGGTPERPAAAWAREHAPPEASDVGVRLVVPLGLGLGAYGSVEVTFRFTDGDGRTAADADCDLRIISMNERLAARTHGSDPVWQRVARPTSPWTTTMVPGAYYVYAERRRDGHLARGVEQKFYVEAAPVDRAVPLPETDLSRYGSGAATEPK